MNSLDRKLQNLDWNEYISKEPMFTEKDKVRIREHLQLRKKKKYSFAPAMLSYAVLTMLFIGLSGYILSNFGIITWNQSATQVDPTKYEKELENLNLPLKGAHIFDPKNVQIDDTFMGGQLKLKSFTMLKHQNDPKEYVEASFIGEVEVRGTISKSDKKINGIDQPYVFLPVQNGGQSFPKSHHDIRTSIIFLDNQKDVEKSLMNYDGREVAVILSNYKINYTSSSSFDSATFVSVVGPIKETPFQFMDNRLISVFENLNKSKDESILKELSPKEIFMLFYYAGSLHDFETQYLLYNHDPNMGGKMTLEEYISESNKNAKQYFIMVEELKQNDQLTEVIVDSQNAHILIDADQGMGFSLSKDQNGIWKANWMPLQ